MYSARLLSWSGVAAILVGILQGQVLTHRESILFAPAHRVDTLAHRPILFGSWRMSDERGEPIDTAWFHIEPISGVVQWHGPLENERSATIRYQAVDGLSSTTVGPAWRYLPSFGQIIVDSSSALRSQSLAKGSSFRAMPSDGLVTTGSLFRGITLMSGHGVDLTGGLNLQLQGELGRGIFVNGSLTDQNLPIQVEGDTRSLNELDQVRLSLSSDWGRIEVGDFVLRGREEPLTSFKRKLEGMRAELRGTTWEVEGALAGSPGRYRSQMIQGQDGRQGPYALSTHEGSRVLIVVPGTEIVWLNGERLERGEAQDYTIDYRAGEVRFTPRHVIRNDSRIVVDFEYTDLVYSRTTGYLSTMWHGDRSRFTVTAFSERDNLQSNLEFSLSEQDRTYLQGIGDQAQKATVSTAIADSAGNYDLVEGRYVWRGWGEGGYRVSFFNVGNDGQYRRIVSGDSIIYQWVTPEDLQRYNVLYSPFRLLKLPRQHDLVAGSWQLRGKTEGRLARVDVGISQVDQNRYSSLEDQDNRDVGYAVQFQWQTKPWQMAARSVKAGIRLDALGKGRNFQAPGRWDAVEFQRDWDLDSQPDGYSWQTAHIFLEGSSEQRIFTELGRIEADSVKTDRLRWGVIKQGSPPLTGRFNQTLLSRLDSQRRWLITDGNVKYDFKRLSPYFRYYGEDREADTTASYRVNQVTLGLQARVAPNTQISLGREQRHDIFEGGPRESARHWLFSLSRSASRSTRLETTLSFNDKRTSGQGEDLSYFMGDFSLVHRPPARPWWLDLRYRLERSIVETKAVVYDSVGVGLGQYRYDPVYDTYVADVMGPYIRYVLPAGELRPVNTIKSRFRIQMDLNRMRLRLGPIKDFAQARLNLQGVLTGDTERYSLPTFIKPSLEDTASHNIRSRLQLDLALQARSNRPRYKLRLLQLIRLNREVVSGTSENSHPGEYFEQSSADLTRTSRHQVAGRTVNLEWQLISERKMIQSVVSTLRNHDIRMLQGNGTVAGTVRGHLTASLSGRWRQEVDQELNDLRVRTLSYGIGLQRTVGAKGRVRLDWEQLHVASSRDIPIPYLLAEGFPAGRSNRIKANGQIHLSRNLLLTITIFSRSEVGQRPFTSSNLELRTQF
ncbi:MAG: hypothetical protein JSW54_13140 [Fidelibacterota bacterium]|nr:MAG: hypothetical protein JSW54_13140 [Candidatus Neomarinimicrobiota bacterium]